MTDARHLEESLEERLETRQQITFADTILLNKQDLVEDEKLTSLQDLLRGINPQAKIIPCTHAEVDTQVLLAEEAKQQQDAKKVISSHHHTHAQSGITTISFVFEQPFEAPALEHWLNVLLMLQGNSIYRIKGTLYLTDTDRQVVFQSVRSQAAYTIGEVWLPEQKKESRLVFIGQDLNRNALEKKLKQCLKKSQKEIIHS